MHANWATFRIACRFHTIIPKAPTNTTLTTCRSFDTYSSYFTSLKPTRNRGLQSKKLAHLEHQLSSNLKATQHRIWSGVTKDVGYLRRVLNELYILKVKVMPKTTMNIYHIIWAYCHRYGKTNKNKSRIFMFNSRLRSSTYIN